MKKLSLSLCIILISILLFSCGNKSEPQSESFVQMGNPWTDHASLSDAEKAADIRLGIPETIAGFTAQVFRTMNGELLEVIYKNGDSEVTVRKQAGENMDISGNYTVYPSVTLTDMEGGSIEERTDGTVTSALISYNGYSYSVYADSGIAAEFINAIIG